MTLLVETDGAGAAATVVDGLRRVLADLDPELPLTGVNTVGAYVDESVAAETLLTRTLSGFAAVTLIVSVIGLYGVVAYSVALRTREFGIRIALGARSVRVLGLVVLEGAVLGVVGAAIGLLGAVAGSRWLASTLYEVAPTDPWTLGPVAVAMLAVAIGATIVPAVRATRVQPTEALRA
jgi:ABC-type antimicrobial peptide transport system permease subunit